MKNIKILLFVLAAICLLTACSEKEEIFKEEISSSESLKCTRGNYLHGLDQERYITMKSTGLKVHYRIIGKGPVNIVFIPGWTNPLEVYQKQFDYFRNKARCIYIDLPGQGESDAPEGVNYTMELMADAIYDVVKKEGIHKFIGVGFSMGPIVLGQFELKHPGMMTKFVNIDGEFSPWPPEGPERDAYAAGLENFVDGVANWGPEEKTWFASMLITDSSPQDIRDFITYFYVFPSWLMANIYWNASLDEVNQPIGWEMPFLCIYSSQPDPDKVQQFFPDATIHVEEGSGHAVQWERADIVNPLIANFVFDYRHRFYRK